MLYDWNLRHRSLKLPFWNSRILEMSKLDDSHGPPQYPPPTYSYEYGGAAGASPGVHVEPYGIVTTVIPLGPSSTRMVCPSCRAEMTTKTITKPGIIAIVSGVIIAALGFVFLVIKLEFHPFFPWQMFLGMLFYPVLHRRLYGRSPQLP